MIRKPIWIGSKMVAGAGERAVYTRTGHGARAILSQSTAASPRAFQSSHDFTFLSHRLLWCSHHLSTGYLGFFFFELGELHRQWCCSGSLEHRISVITAALPLALTYQHFSLHISVTLFSVLGAGRNMAEPDAFEQERYVDTVAVRPCWVYQITRVHPISEGTKKLTRAGIAETVSRDQVFRRERG